MSGTSTNGRAGRLTINEDAQAMIDVARDEDIETVWDRLAAQQPQCGYCALGLSCRNCAMGPCRIDPFGEGPQKGVCGADADVIVARNLGPDHRRRLVVALRPRPGHPRDLRGHGPRARPPATASPTRTSCAGSPPRSAWPPTAATSEEVASDLADVLCEDYGTPPGVAVVRRARPRGPRGPSGTRWASRRGASTGRTSRCSTAPTWASTTTTSTSCCTRLRTGPGRRLGRIDDRHRALRRHVRHADTR